MYKVISILKNNAFISRFVISRHIKFLVSLLIVGAFVLPLTYNSGNAVAADTNFKGKKITIWTPHKGGASVLSLKLWSKYIAKYLTGNPKHTVKPKFGGGGVTNPNFFQKTAKPDGLTATMANLPSIVSHSIKRKGVKYDMSKWHVIGAEPDNYILIAGKSSKVRSINDLRGAKRSMSFGTRKRNLGTMAYEYLWRAAENPISVIAGFGGNDTVVQALGSGEIPLSYIRGPQFLKQAVTFKDLGIVGITQDGVIDKSGKIIRSSRFPNMPTTHEALLKINPKARGTETERVITTLPIMRQLSKVYFLPGGTSKSIIGAWRSALTKSAADTAFLAEHKKTIGVPFTFVEYKQAASLFKNGLSILSDPFYQKGGKGYAMYAGGKKKKKK